MDLSLPDLSDSDTDGLVGLRPRSRGAARRGAHLDSKVYEPDDAASSVGPVSSAPTAVAARWTDRPTLWYFVKDLTDWEVLILW